MPCYDPGPTQDALDVAALLQQRDTIACNEVMSLNKANIELREYSGKLEAMLCGIMTAIDAFDDCKRVLKRYDEAETGVSLEHVRTWFKMHKEQDQVRRNKESTKKIRGFIDLLSKEEYRILQMELEK